MRRAGVIVIGILACLMFSPVLLAQNEAKPVILLYHGPKVGDQDLRLYGQALADAINSDPRMKDKAEIVLVGDQDLMNTLLYFPQVKCAVVALTTWELHADRIVPSLLWYFNEGGAVVGLGNAGHGDVTKVLNATVFPLFGNQYNMVKPKIYTDPATGKRVIVRETTYKKVTDHPIAEGAADEFTLKDKRFVVHMNTSMSPPKYLHMEPEKGEYTMVYADSDLGAPLVVVYEENGTSITFAGTDQISTVPTDETYFGNLVEDDNFKKLFQNSVYYAWTHETKYEDAMAKASEAFKEMKKQQDELKARVSESQKKAKSAKLVRSVGLIVVGLVLIVIISYFCFVVPARQRREGETPEAAEAAETPREEGG